MSEQTKQDPLSDMDDLFNEYEETHAQKNGSLSRKELTKRTFFIPRDENLDFKTIRILPPRKDLGEKNISEVLLHFFKYRNNWMNVWCAKNDGKDCPVCAKGEEIRDKANLLKESDPVKSKEMWMKGANFFAKKYFVIRVIDRGKIDEGVKFWYFPYSKDRKGILDQMMGVLKMWYADTNIDWRDPKEGCDIRVTLGKNDKGKTTITGFVTARKSTPLSTNEEEAKKWLEDKYTYTDIIKAKSLLLLNGIDEDKYLQLVAEGNIPSWDATKKRWIITNHPELEELANARSKKVDTKDSDDKAEKNEAEDDLFGDMEKNNKVLVDKKVSTEKVNSKTTKEEDPFGETTDPLDDLNVEDIGDDLPF
jgi:hypothetical protein